MRTYTTIKLIAENQVARIIFQRPNFSNAFNDVMIHELLDAILFLKSSNFRVLVITGEGKSFCAGGDMNWMQQVQKYSLQQNLEDCTRLSTLFTEINNLPFPTIAKVNGAAVGGGVGFIAASDIAIASDSAMFSMSEVKMGLVPACIASFLIERVGLNNARVYFLTGRRLSAQQAKEIGLVHELCPIDSLEQRTQEWCEELLQCGPQALKMAKELLKKVPRMSEQQFISYSAETVANMRLSSEGQEGFAAFLEKRTPSWRTHVSKNINR